MISSNTRASRSRFSSPARQQHQNGGAKGDGNGTHEASRPSANERSRAFMEKWLEPSLQNKPSFEEAGLMRHGVLETMAPLGTLPKPKKGGQENGSTSAVRKIILRPSGAGSAAKTATNDAASSPLSATAAAADAPTSTANTTTTTTTTTTPSSTSPSPLLIPPASAPATVVSPSELTSKATSPLSTSRRQARKSQSQHKEDMDDDDYEPKKLSHRRQSAIPSLPAKKGRPPSSVRRSSLTVAPLSPVRHRPKMPPSVDSQGSELAEKVVEAAVDEALQHYRYPTAWALKKLYEENAGDASFVTMIEDVFTQTADESTLQEFSRQVEKKKREGNKDKQGCYRFFQLTSGNRFTPHKPLPAPYTNLIHHDEEQEEPEARAAKKIKVTHSKAAATTPRKLSLSSSAVGVNGNKLRTPASRKRARRGSATSDSSLSSAISLSSPEVTRTVTSPTPAIRRARAKAKFQEEEEAAAAGATSTNISTTANSNPEPPSQSSGAPKTRPITTRGKSLASSKHQQTAVSNTSRPNSPTLSSSASRPQRKKRVAAEDASMPGRLAPEEPPVSKTFTTPSTKNGHQAQMPHEYQESWDRRKDAQKVTNNYMALESSIRDGEEELLSTPARSTRRSTRQSLNAPPSTRATRSARKRSIEVGERTASPVSVLNHGGDGSSVVGSRAVTPTNLPPAKKQKTGLRVKLSPIKKKGGTAAGLPRQLGEGQSGTSQGNLKEQATDNDEYCSACGNVGDVVCCDGCPRSFHFECVDMDRTEDLPAEWYCNECLVTRYPSRVPVHKGVFAAALNNLEKSIPRAFSLPKKLQNRFEGVRAGTDGDYEEVISRAARKKASGYEEAPDFFKQREDGEAVICHDCQKPATEIRAIIPCSVCSLYWHIDCLDPPLAVPPVLKTWRCPAHADDLLAEAPPLAPAHRFRKIKGAQTITPAIGRGLRNNGHIEIDWSEEPDQPDHSGWKDYASFGRTYKIPAQGVVLDFIERMQKQKQAVAATHEDEPRRMAPYLTPPVEDRDRLPPPSKVPERSVDEMQASLILTSLRQSPAQGVDQLTSALLASADSNVIALIAKGNAANIAREQLASTDRLSLQALLTQMDNMSSSIRQILAEEASSTNLGPSAIQEGKSASSIKSDSLIIEPTPPSTIDHNESVMDLD